MSDYDYDNAPTDPHHGGKIWDAPRPERDREGILEMQPSGRWAVCRAGRVPVEITSGEVFRIAVPGTKALKVTSMEFRHLERGGGEYYSVDGHRLYNGLRAGLGSE